MAIIYCVTNTINGKKYVGQTVKTLEVRWKEHLRDARRYDYNFPRAIKKYGHDCWKLEVLEEVDSSNVNNREVYWIEHLDTFNNGYNSTIGGGQGTAFSDEHRQKLKNRVYTDEWKQRIGNGVRGKTKGIPKSAEHIKKIKARIITEEWRKRLSEARKGKVPWNKGLKLSSCSQTIRSLETFSGTEPMEEGACSPTFAA